MPQRRQTQICAVRRLADPCENMQRAALPCSDPMPQACGKGDAVQTIDEALVKLRRSSFRAKFHLSAADKAYTSERGLDTVRRHAEDFVRTRLAPAVIPNDGRQTPMRGHPVFVAQHACACCCRGCLFKWYRVPKERALTDDEQARIVRLLMAWIVREYESK